MVFSTTTLFKGIACPEAERCALTNCIFSHDLHPTPPEPAAEALCVKQTQSQSNGEPALKRRKIAHDKGPSRADLIREELAAARNAVSEKANEKLPQSEHGLLSNGSPVKPPSTLTRPVSPPPAKTVNGNNVTKTHPDLASGNVAHTDSKHASTHPATKTETISALNPQLIPNDPVGHAKRSVYLKYIHGEMMRLHALVQSNSLPPEQKKTLTAQRLINMAVEEEERLAREHGSLYGNIIKNRIAVYKKMTMDEWLRHINITLPPPPTISPPPTTPRPTTEPNKPLQTDLTPAEELLLLPRLIADQNPLTKHGYIPTPPSATSAAEAAAAVTASQNYELCDRCSARFRIFPNRNAEGLLTSHGPCRHHPAKRIFPSKSRGDVASGSVKEAYYPCCNAVLGSEGCEEKEWHVFKSSSPGRLASVMEFISTPENAAPKRAPGGGEVAAVCFDCEMGYTVFGMECLRLTACSWPQGEVLVDVLVRPLGTVLDLNSRFSGVWAEDFTRAVEYEEWLLTHQKTPGTAPSSPAPTAATTATHGAKRSRLPIVSSPSQARTLLLAYLTPRTPLIGHALENDLNTLRLCHPSIVDSVLLFPHPRGLPMRFGLRVLAQRHLGWRIQGSGAGVEGKGGHDSGEDARAAGELVRVKVGEIWKGLRGRGWTSEDGRLVGPNVAGGKVTGTELAGENGCENEKAETETLRTVAENGDRSH